MKDLKKRLVIILYSTSPNSLVFSHQLEVAKDLTYFFDETILIGCEVSLSSNPRFSKVIDLKWSEQNKLQNISNLIQVFFRDILLTRKQTVIFSYMTEVQSAILAPLTRIFGIPHYLWYAHTNKSVFLRWCHSWLTKIITSTWDSCPYNDSKVEVIGQNIDDSKFIYSQRKEMEISKGIYVGRLDPSKKIEEIIEFLRKFQSKIPAISISLAGESTFGHDDYLAELRSQNSDLIESGNLIFLGKIANGDLPKIIKNYDFFINVFEGSLDKSLIEATMLGIPVVTSNIPYLNCFGYWSNPYLEVSRSKLISNEFQHIIEMAPDKREQICRDRAEVAIAKHSRRNWIHKIIRILSDE